MVKVSITLINQIGYCLRDLNKLSMTIFGNFQVNVLFNSYEYQMYAKTVDCQTFLVVVLFSYKNS